MPVAAPSANRSRELSPTRAEHVLKGLDGRIDLILDGGPCPGGIESTVVDVTGPVVRLLRPGPVTVAQLEAVVGRVEVAPTCRTGPLPSPGMLTRHYAPRTPLELAETEDEADFLARTCTRRPGCGWRGAPLTGSPGGGGGPAVRRPARAGRRRGTTGSSRRCRRTPTSGGPSATG